MTLHTPRRKPTVHAAITLERADLVIRHLADRLDPAAPFSVADLADLLAVPMPRAYDVIRYLVKAGRAEVAEPRQGATPGLWRPANRPPVASDRKAPTANDQMWDAMRAMPRFTPTALANHANVGEAEVTVEAARKYCRALLQAGYLRVLQRADKGNEAVYRLVQRSGLKAPNLRRVLAVVDANTNTTVVIGGGQ